MEAATPGRSNPTLKQTRRKNWPEHQTSHVYRSSFHSMVSLNLKDIPGATQAARLQTNCWNETRPCRASKRSASGHHWPRCTETCTPDRNIFHKSNRSFKMLTNKRLFRQESFVGTWKRSGSPVADVAGHRRSSWDAVAAEAHWSLKPSGVKNPQSQTLEPLSNSSHTPSPSKM